MSLPSFADSTPIVGQAAGVFLPYDIILLENMVDLCNTEVFVVDGQAAKLPATITGEVHFSLVGGLTFQVCVWVKPGMLGVCNPRS